MNSKTNFPPRLWSPIYSQTDQQSKIVDRILQVLNEQEEGCNVELADLTPFEWDRVCLFGMGASHEYVNQVIGFEWLDGKGYVQEQRQLFVFTRGKQVVEHLLFRPEIVRGNFESWRMGVCLSPTEAVFTIDGYVEHNKRIPIFRLSDSGTETD